MQNDLKKALDRLTRNERYLSVVQNFSGDLHDIFEEILLESLTNNPGEPIDGAAILAICMKCFKGLQTVTPTQNIVPAMTGLPSQNYGKSE